MAATMKPTDALVQKISLEVGCPLPCMGIEETKRTYSQIAAIAERAVREQVAKEIEAAERALSETDPATAEASHRITAWCGGLLEGARLARGETTTTTPTTKENSK